MHLSIITINYNNLEGLKKTVRSVMDQTWRDFEWIIIDGGSTDGSRELIEEVAARPDSQVSYWCSEPDKGIYNAMNKGIAKAKGEYLNFMNSGDCFFTNSSLKNVFSKNISGDIVYCNGAYGNIDHYYIRELPHEVRLSYLLYKSLCHQSSFIKGNLFIGHLYDENLKIVSDWKNWIIWLLEGRNYEYLNETVSLFDMSGISTKNLKLVEFETELVFKELFTRHIQELSNDYIDMVRKSSDLEEPTSELSLVYKYIHTRRLYKRSINLLLRLIGWLEKASKWQSFLCNQKSF